MPINVVTYDENVVVSTSGETVAAIVNGGQGPQGPAGAAATITVGTVTTGAPGSSVSVTNSGSSSAAVLNFRIPAGQAGATGPQGPQGPAGSNATATTDASALVTGTLPDARLSSNIARTSDVTSAVAAVVNAAPASLDTLKELADALGNDASFASTVTNSLAAKAPINSPTFTGTVSGVTKSHVGLSNVPNVDATARANHTGTQAISTIVDLQAELESKAAASHGHTGADITLSPSGDDPFSLSDPYAADFLLFVGIGSSSPISAVRANAKSVCRALIDAAAATHTHTLSSLTQSGASTGQVVAWSGSAWAASTITPAGIGAAAASHTHSASAITDFFSAAVAAVTWTTLTGKPTFSTVATTGAYSDLSGRPTLGTAAAANTTDFAAASHTQAWSTITSTPTTLAGYGITDGLTATSLASPPAIGGTAPAAGSFTTLVASTSLAVPSGASATPAAGHLYRSADTIRYRDSSNTERLLLNSADNLANLGSTATARSNLGLGSAATAATSDFAAASHNHAAGAITSGTLSVSRLPTVLEQTVTGGNTGTSVTLSLTNGSVQTWTLSGNCTFTMPSAAAGASLTIFLTQGGTNTATFTGVLWSGGTAPTITATNGKVDVLVFVSNGTSWYGTALQNF